MQRQVGLTRRKSIAPANGNLERSKSIVLLDTSTGEIESEFHAYVQSPEHPVLSEFCTELPGIKQAQVDEGVPLKICLSRFCKWIQKTQQQKKIIFASGVADLSTSKVKLCAFDT
uniref:Exonuclease domain-containing protein n=1 Tax=Equus asinus TaxID=9793 RepID=A0A9L0JHC8_EQUAS